MIDIFLGDDNVNVNEVNAICRELAFFANSNIWQLVTFSRAFSTSCSLSNFWIDVLDNSLI